MPKYKIIIEYDGTDFHGWQSQKNVTTIQNAIENALFKLTQKEVKINGASRTDAGVHAYGQVAHFNLEKPYELHKIQDGVNHYLKLQNICIINVEEVDENFHARFSAKNKQYVYKILNRVAPPVLLKNKAWHVKYMLDTKAMQEASNYLIGTHDFSSFRAVGCQAISPIKSIDAISVNQINEEIHITLNAKSFLYNQVRIIAGTLYNFGRNKLLPIEMEGIIRSRDRRLAGETAPGHGLYLEKIEYLN